MASFILNGEAVNLDVAPDTPLLWVLRDHLKMTGTKFGCGLAQCGACTIHFNGNATRSCVLPVAAIEGQQITTIESFKGEHPLQKAWVEHQVPQCGYCQSGQIMSAASLLSENPNPSDEEIKTYMSGNICRCGTYPRIFKAIKSVVQHYDPLQEKTADKEV